MARWLWLTSGTLGVAPAVRLWPRTSLPRAKELASDDIVWIYLADESSSVPLYLDMIKEIKGHHYLLNADQVSAVRKQFGVDGIPYYILVDKKGKATGRPDLRDHSKFKKTILEELAK